MNLASIFEVSQFTSLRCLQFLKIHYFISVSWLDHHGMVMTFFQTHVIDMSLSQCGTAHIASCGSNMSKISDVACSGTSIYGIIDINRLTIRGDATKSCKITCSSRGYSSPVSDIFTIELRAALLKVNLNSVPSPLYLGDLFSISCE